MKKINKTYKAFKDDREKNGDKSVEVRVYNNITGAEIEQVNGLPDSLYKNTEIKCNDPKTTGGRKSKRRKSKRRRLTKSKK